MSVDVVIVGSVADVSEELAVPGKHIQCSGHSAPAAGRG